MRPVNTMYSPHRMVTPAPNQGVTYEDIQTRVIEILGSSDRIEFLHKCLLFAILKEGCSIPKLERFTGCYSGILRSYVEGLRSRGELFTGQLSNQFILSQVPGSEDLIERITGQRIPKKESTKMSIIDEVYDQKTEPTKPKRKYKPRAKKPRPVKGDGTLRIAKAATSAPAKRKTSKPKVEFSIIYIDDWTEFKKSGESMEQLREAMGLIQALDKEGE